VVDDYYEMGKVDKATDLATQLYNLAPDEQTRQRFKARIDIWQQAKAPAARPDTGS
jgi:predicted Zn-dependent protease